MRETDSSCNISTDLSASTAYIENKYINVRLDENGDICSVFDKRLNRELLSKPIRLALLNNTHSFDWPAWEIKYDDCKNEPYAYPQNPQITVKENGCALCSVLVTRYIGKSRFTQEISLSSESKYVSVYNETDWREEASLLKAEFSFTAKNKYANYDIGLGYTQRATNTEKLYEVPAQKWADITDENNEFGISVLSDSRQGWDKPDESTLRLTLIHTPMSNYRWECSQHVMDMGINRYSYAIIGHNGKPSDITAYADSFNQPMHTFISDKHSGTLGSEYSFVKLSDNNVRIIAIKKSQNSDDIIFRVAECSGTDKNDIKAVFSLPITDADLVTGDETKLTKAEIENGFLSFNLKHNEIKSFALKFEKKSNIKRNYEILNLNCNSVGITTDKNRKDSTLKNGISIPTELIPDKILSAGIEYSITTDKRHNCLLCDGSEIAVDNKYTNLYLLITSLNGDKTVGFRNGEKEITVTVPDYSEPLGYCDFMQQGETGYIKPIPQAITFSHTHCDDSDIIAKQFYLFSVKIPLGDSNKITLPDDKEIVIFAATATEDNSLFIKGDEHFDSLKKRKFDYEFSDYAVKLMNPNKLEKLLDKFIDREFNINIKTGEFYNKYSFGELYYILRNLKNKMFYQKNVTALTEKRKPKNNK